MATVSISFNCGCNQKFNNIIEAVYHSNQTGHSLCVVGTIIADKNKKELEKARRKLGRV